MKKFYSPEIIDDLMESVPYEEVLRHYGYPVKGSGKNRGSDCPKCGKNYHHFKINTHRNTAHCFPCNWGGNPIQFIQEVDQVGFIAAVEKYAEIGNYSLPIFENKKRTYTVKERILYHTVQFYKQFTSDYLTKRGISEDVIKEYQIGFAPGGTELKKYLNSRSFSDEQLIEAGVIVERHGQLKDFFYNCVIVPVINHGMIVDLYGRYTKAAKIKHIYLYGDHIAFNLDSIKEEMPVIVVESIVNALTLFSNGITNVFATGGSLFIKRHARQLKARNTKKAYVGYDTGDLSKAGQKGAIQAGKVLEEMSIPTNIIQMPEETDINELFLQYDDAFDRLRNLIGHSDPVKEYEVKFLLNDMPDEWIEEYLHARKGNKEESA